MNWTRIKLQEIDSTNTYIYNKVEETNVVVTAEHQTAGRGQGENKWESEASQNLLFSIKVSPKAVPANRQFILSMAGALALKSALDGFADGFSLKWPNDIYWNNLKISGTLIETSITGKHIKDCIFGVGVNVNQRQFHSDAPNPVSLFQIIGQETDREELLASILKQFEYYYNFITDGRWDEIATLYNSSLYRRQGFYLFEDKNGKFEAEITEVSSTGHLILHDKNGIRRAYELKEVRFIID